MPLVVLLSAGTHTYVGVKLTKDRLRSREAASRHTHQEPESSQEL